MKGVIFDEFINMIEERFSPDMADRVISASNLATGGAYTSIGTYDYRELVELVGHLSEETGLTIPALLHSFGEYLFKRFCVLYPSYVVEHESTFGLLTNLDHKIHVEVKKLYHDAELPRFNHEWLGPSKMTLVYRSKRPFSDLAEGLIQGCITHFAENIALIREELPTEQGAHTRFTLMRQSDGRGP